jgi:hypothetical protein
MKSETKNKDWWKQFHWQDNPHSVGEAALKSALTMHLRYGVLGEK